MQRIWNFLLNPRVLTVIGVAALAGLLLLGADAMRVGLLWAGVVLGVSTLLIAALTAVLPALPLPVAEALGHGVGIAAGAVSNYFGHQILTFGVRRGGHAPAGAHTL